MMQSVPRRVATSVLAVGLIAGAVSAQTPIYTQQGFVLNLGYGYMVRGLGDVNADGVPDYFIGGQLQNLAEVRSGRTGALIRSHPQGVLGACFGMSATNMGDLDDDGVEDYVIGAPRETTDQGPSAPGGYWAFSGQTGAPLYTVKGFQSDSRFALFLDRLGDVDDDGYDDILIGAIWDSTVGHHAGAAYVHSGKTGALLYSLYGSQAEDLFGYGVTGLGDVSGDGVPDFAVGAPRDFTDSSTTLPPGYVRVFSGADGSLLYQFDGNQMSDQYGLAVGGLEDIDGDGRAELLVGAAGHSSSGSPRGLVEVRSGATGALIRSHVGLPNSQFGCFLRTMGDLDADGISEILVGASYSVAKLGKVYTGNGYVEVLSGLAGTSLMKVQGTTGTKFGRVADGAGDLNGDGVPDFLVGAPYAATFGPLTGAAYAFSGKPLPLYADKNEISISLGGTQTLTVDAGVAHAGETYLMLGSVTGTSPGINLGSDVHLPLNFDIYTSFTISYANAFFLPQSLGTLDANGVGHPKLSLPAGVVPVEADGLTLFHAVLTRSGSHWTSATNAVPVSFKLF